MDREDTLRMILHEKVDFIRIMQELDTPSFWGDTLYKEYKILMAREVKNYKLIRTAYDQERTRDDPTGGDFNLKETHTDGTPVIIWKSRFY